MYLSDSDFQAADFVQSLGLSPSSTEFCDGFTKTQLFHRFIEERRDWNDPEVRFFDESINAKVNRSRKNTLMNFGRSEVKDTAFLDDTSRVVRNIIAFLEIHCIC